LGEQQIWGKHSPFERALRSTLIIRGPGIKARGPHSNIVESLDIYPTLIDLCQPSFTETANTLNGKSIKDFLTDQSNKTRDFALSYWRGAISIRNKTHRLIHNQKSKAVMLYDLSKDLDNMKDISDSEPDIVKNMLKALP